MMREQMPMPEQRAAQGARIPRRWLPAIGVSALAVGYVMAASFHNVTENLPDFSGEHSAAVTHEVPDPVPWQITVEPRPEGYVDTRLSSNLLKAVCATARAPQYASRLFPGASAIDCQRDSMGVKVHALGQIGHEARLADATISFTPITTRNFRLEALEPNTKCNFVKMLCTRRLEGGALRAESLYEGGVATVVYEKSNKAGRSLVIPLGNLATDLAKLPGSLA